MTLRYNRKRIYFLVKKNYVAIMSKSLQTSAKQKDPVLFVDVSRKWRNNDVINFFATEAQGTPKIG